MIGQELIIIFNQSNAFITPDNALTFEQIGLPQVAGAFKKLSYWKFRVLNFIPAEKKIYAEILSYQNGTIEFSNTQLQLAGKLDDIENVTFRSVDTTGMLRTLELKDHSSTISPVVTKVIRNEIVYEEPKQFIKEPIKRTFKEIFFFPIKDIHFLNGCVSLEKKLTRYGKTVQVSIKNDNIREEFDAVKNYFANILNTKKIEITATIEEVDGQFTAIEAESPEIQKINKSFIDDVKFELIKHAIKKKVPEVDDKILYTVEEYFETFAEKVKPGSFYNNENELLEDLLAISDTKHYRHLRFLSSKHLHSIMKLRLIHKPFSFVFLLAGDKEYHIIWETLDTAEATYIWHVEKGPSLLKVTLAKIGKIISLIRAHGKTEYISKTEDPFERIYHEYTETAEGFVKWKGELENVLI